jgi:broad specificity phosphatase PhoE
MSPQTVILARHASTHSTHTKRLLGRMDETLSEVGFAQASTLARMWRERLVGRTGGAVVTSPLKRASLTAGLIAESLAWSIQRVSGLAERDFGSWTGRTLTELLACERNAAEQFIRDPLSVTPEGAEHPREFEDRVLDAWSSQVDRAKTDASHGANTTMVAIVTHDGPLRIILRHIGFGDALESMPLYGIEPCWSCLLTRDNHASPWRRAADSRAQLCPLERNERRKRSQ